MSKKDNNNMISLPIGMCIGLSFGTAIGAATHNLGLWMPIGLSIGLCLGASLQPLFSGKKDKDGTDNADQGEGEN